MKSKIPEWNPLKKWNPFNSFKYLAQIERWKKIKRGQNIPAPILITVDPSNFCNLNCDWCNAEFIRKKGGKLSRSLLLKLATFLPKWKEDGVEAICIAGGGEPLLNLYTADFIESLIYNGIEVGIVTNGTMLRDFIQPLSKLTWVGVSIDAATEETYNKYKHPPVKWTFEEVIQSITILAEYSKSHKSKLSYLSPSHGITYKFLLYKDNIKEMYHAAKLAKFIGCKNIHFRPAGTVWNNLEENNVLKEITFSKEEIQEFQEQIIKTLELDDENFSVYGITHKFTSQFGVANYFPKCYAIFMTAVAMPPTDTNIDGFNLELCCDRRGDNRIRLIENGLDISDINKVWGQEEHWAIHDKIKIEEQCPRCTFQPHNEIYEYVIKQDSMSYKFI